MKLWTIQKAGFDKQLNESKQIIRSLNNVEKATKYQYIWLICKMRQRGIPVEHASTPFWAWFHYEGSSRPKPNLNDEGHYPPNTDCVCVELNVPDSLVLLSQFEMWVWVLNRWYVAGNKNEIASLEKYGVKTREMFQSWDRIFDLKFGCPKFWGKLDDRQIQAVIPYIKSSWIQNVENFIAK